MAGFGRNPSFDAFFGNQNITRSNPFGGTTMQQDFTALPVDARDPYFMEMMPVNFVPIGQQMSLLQQAGMQGFVINMNSGQYTYISNQQGLPFHARQFGSQCPIRFPAPAVPDVEATLLQPMQSYRTEESQLWHNYYTHVSEMAEAILSRRNRRLSDLDGNGLPMQDISSVQQNGVDLVACSAAIGSGADNEQLFADGGSEPCSQNLLQPECNSLPSDSISNQRHETLQREEPENSRELGTVHLEIPQSTGAGTNHSVIPQRMGGVANQLMIPQSLGHGANHLVIPRSTENQILATHNAHSRNLQDFFEIGRQPTQQQERLAAGIPESTRGNGSIPNQTTNSINMQRRAQAFSTVLEDTYDDVFLSPPSNIGIDHFDSLSGVFGESQDGSYIPRLNNRYQDRISMSVSPGMMGVLRNVYSTTIGRAELRFTTHQLYDQIHRRSLARDFTTLFFQLHDEFFFDLFIWIFTNVTTHPRSTNTRTLLCIMGDVMGQNPQDILLSMLAGFLEGVILTQRRRILPIIRLLLQLDYSQEINPENTSAMQAFAVQTNIHLDPRQLLRRFGIIVCNGATVLVRNNPVSSPGTRRRTRERNTYRPTESSPDRRAFHPPNTTAGQMHHAALHQQSQQPVMMDHEQIQTTAPVTVAPYAIPICTGQHHFPVCTSAHIPVCTSQPTWSIPACGMQIPTCSMQHIPACSLPQMPLPGPLNPMMPHSQGAPHLSHQHHITAGPHFNPNPVRHQPENVHLLQEHRPAFSIPPTLHSHHLNPSPPVLLQEPPVHTTPHDIYVSRLQQGPFQRYYARQRTVGRSGRLRSLAPAPPSLPPPPPPIYPGFILHFLAMLGNPPVPPFSRDIHDEATEVENYEALLNLAERLGEAKPRGLTKTEIKQLPAYQFNSESSRSDSDQTSCVVCMCDFENRQLLRVLPCSHEFHSKCVDKWLKTNRTCPICRADATEAGSPSD